MLTDAIIRHAKPAPRPVKISDGGGLHLLIQPHGSKLWRLAYRYGGRQRTLAFGAYPTVGLRDARLRRELAKQSLAEGIDPGAVRKVERQAEKQAEEGTFAAVADEWLEKKQVKENKAKRTLERSRWLLRVLKDGLGDRPISEIEPPELLDVLRLVEARGHHETTARLRATASRVFRYGIATGRCKRDPAADLRGAFTTATPEPRPALTDPTAIGELMRAIDGFDGHSVTRAALRFLALTFVRPGELRSAEWSEFDLGAKVWSIPASKMKMRSPLRVPLSKQAVEVLCTLPASGRYVFSISDDAPLSENTLNVALVRMGYDTKTEHCAHGFRAMASTSLNEMQRWPSDVIERQLAHRERNSVRRAYNRAEHWPQRIAMMQVWSDRLDELRGRGKVVRIPVKRVRS